MKVLTVYRFQSAAYLLIIIFAIQHFLFSGYSFNYIFYETVVSVFFIASVIIILVSVIPFIVESIITLNRKTIVETELKYLIINLILYYSVIASSFYLFTQTRL